MHVFGRCKQGVLSRMLRTSKFCLALLLLLPGLGFASTEWENLSHYIATRYIQDMAKAGLLATGFRSGEFRDENKLSIDFRSTYSPTLAQARIIFVNSMENLLYRLNQSPRARRYARNGPFTSDNVRLSIDFRSPSGSRYGSAFVSYVVNSERGVVYCVYDPDPNNINHLKVVLREPYHYADEIAQSN